MARVDVQLHEQRLLEYVMAETRPPIGLGELAEALKLEVDACKLAMRRLASHGEIRVVIHPGAHLELRPGGVPDGGRSRYGRY